MSEDFDEFTKIGPEISQYDLDDIKISGEKPGMIIE